MAKTRAPGSNKSQSGSKWTDRKRDASAGSNKNVGKQRTGKIGTQSGGGDLTRGRLDRKAESAAARKKK